jgi:hypothetical protein
MSPELQNRLRVAFDRLNTVGATKAFPKSRALSESLSKLTPTSPNTQINVPPKIAELFVTASVDMWLRSVHSFLISASLTGASPIWTAVSGYYSSHYSVRAIAHLLGHFLLFGQKRVVRWELDHGNHVCSFKSKGAGDREHKLYWNLVKEDEHFDSDPLFTKYDPAAEVSDVRHRDRANYSDHLYPYPAFRALDRPSLKERIQIISQIEFADPPIPDISQFVDIDSIQIVAYHRIVRYRRFLDEALGGGNRFWNVHRNPGFVSDLLNFQITEARKFIGFEN